MTCWGKHTITLADLVTTMPMKLKSANILIVMKKFRISIFLHLCICEAGVQFGNVKALEENEENERKHSFMMITQKSLYQLLLNYFPSFGHLVIRLEPLNSWTTFIMRILSKMGYQVYQEDQTNLLCDLLEHISEPKILSITSLMIQLSVKKQLWRLLNCMTFLISLLLLETMLYMWPAIQRIVILIQWGGDAVFTKMIYLFLISRSETKYGFRQQPITIPTTSLSHTPSMQHLHYLPGLMVSLIPWSSTPMQVRSGRLAVFVVSGFTLMSDWHSSNFFYYRSYCCWPSFCPSIHIWNPFRASHHKSISRLYLMLWYNTTTGPCQSYMERNVSWSKYWLVFSETGD